MSSKGEPGPKGSRGLSNAVQASTSSVMQRLMDEIYRSSQRIEEFTRDEFGNSLGRPRNERHLDHLYDDAWKSEDSDASLHEVPVDYQPKNDDSGCEDAVNSVIAEVSKDFLSGMRANSAANQYGDSDESRISSDTEFKLLTGTASYARYPETAAGLSDNDWNPYGTESDTNASPRAMPSNISDVKMSDSRLSSMMSFNPPYHSSDLNIVTPSSAVNSITDPASRMSDIQELTERDTAVYLKPDISADFSTISHMSEQIFSPHKSFRDAVKPPELNRTLRGAALETGKDYESQDRGNERCFQNGIVSSLEGQGLANAGSDAYSAVCFDKGKESNQGRGQYVSVFERAKLMGVPEDVLDGNSQPLHETSHEEKDDNSRDGLSKKYNKASSDDEDFLGQRVQKVLYDTKYLEKGSGPKSESNTAVDYNMLQKDLQEIQDSLQRTLGPAASCRDGLSCNKNDHMNKKTPTSSDNEGDIIPSTTTTPERKRNKMAWDFAADLGYQQPGGLMGDVSLDTYTSNSQKHSGDKQSYNSDGNETRTSGSSDKVDDHAAADQVLAEMSEILRPQTGDIHSSQDVDQVITNFRDQRKQIESRYQQLNNQGLAEKVYRILTNQDPESQADGILSQVSAEERQMKTRYALGLNNKDFNFSTNSDCQNESDHSFALTDDVRKKLDLSGLSSADVSRLLDIPPPHVPAGKGFTAFEDMTKFLSSQMAKVSEKTFNQSLEMRLPPQVIQCYPLFKDNKDSEEAKTKAEGNQSNLAKPQTADSQETNRGGSRDDRPTSSSSPKDLNAEPQDQSNNSPNSANDSDSSTGRRREKYRPYRPAGSREVYYTESDAASVADSVTTMESTHQGSDDARGPTLPSSVLGSRKDPPNTVGIYGNRKPLTSLQDGETLPPIQEKSGLDDRESESNQSSHRDQTSQRQSPIVAPENVKDRENSGGAWKTESKGISPGVNSREGRQGGAGNERISVQGSDMPESHSVAAARRNARWANWEDDRQREHTGFVRRAENRSINKNAGIESSVDSNKREYESRRVREYESETRLGSNTAFLSRDRDRPSGDYGHYGSGDFLHSDYNRTSTFEDRQAEPLSLRIAMTYDSNTSSQDTVPKLRDGQEIFNSRAKDDHAMPYSSSSLYPEAMDRPYRRKFVDGEKPYSPQVREDYSPPRRRDHMDRHTGVHRSRSDEDLYSPVSDARLSLAFHRALSPDLRQAIENRSPLLSRHIERSLAQPPAINPELQSRRRWGQGERDFARSLSPPPTFLARDSSRSPRAYVFSPGNRRQPSGQARERSWSPTLQPRSLSPSFTQRNGADRYSPSAGLTGRHTPNNGDGQAKRDGPGSRKASPPSPKRKVELTLENMSSDTDDTEMDQEPISKRAQLLKHALTQEQEVEPGTDINALWEQFKAINESNDSSMNSSRMEAVADLLRNPSRHMVGQYLKEREDYRMERQERAEVERERRVKEQMQLSKLSSSEDDQSANYKGLQAQKEEERAKRRMAKKKKGKPAEGKIKATQEEQRNQENVPENLFSIPEDASFEQSPAKPSSSSRPQKAKVPRQPNIIDPNMNKLRERIEKQKKKIDKNTLKEMQRVDKLKKLEHLLTAKNKGEIGDQTLEMQMEDLSSTSTPGSDYSQDRGLNTTPLSDDSTTAKDSSAEMHAWKAEKERRVKEMREMESRKGLKQPKAHKARSSRDTKGQTSPMRLLKLVKDGFLTPDEAYRLATERARELPESDTSMNDTARSSSDDWSGNHSGRFHKFYSPYNRRDMAHMAKPRHAPKLKHLPSHYETGSATHSYNDRGRQKLAWADFDEASFSRPGSGYIRPKSAYSVHSKSRSPGAGDRPVISFTATPRSSSQDRQVLHRASPSRSGFSVSTSPSRFRQRLSPDRRQQASSLSSTSQNGSAYRRPHSSSPSRRAGHRYSTRQGSIHNRAYGSENKPPHKGKESVAWHIPIDKHPSQWEEPKSKTQSQPRPLQERKMTENKVPMRLKPQLQEKPVGEGLEPFQSWDDKPESDNGIWHKSDHPRGIPKQQWEEIVRHDALATKTNHWEVDPLMDRVQYILNKETEDGEEGKDGGKQETWEEKPLGKLSLQEAFMARKQTFISKCRERQKRLALAKDNRHMQECLRLEREAIFADQDRLAPTNVHAHPYSDNLYQPKRRILSKLEMKELTSKRYKKLPEVKQRQEKEKKMTECKLNRLRLRIFNRKVQKEALKKNRVHGAFRKNQVGRQ